MYKPLRWQKGSSVSDLLCKRPWALLTMPWCAACSAFKPAWVFASRQRFCNECRVAIADVRSRMKAIGILEVYSMLKSREIFLHELVRDVFRLAKDARDDFNFYSWLHGNLPDDVFEEVRPLVEHLRAKAEQQGREFLQQQEQQQQQPAIGGSSSTDPPQHGQQPMPMDDIPTGPAPPPPAPLSALSEPEITERFATTWTRALFEETTEITTYTRVVRRRLGWSCQKAAEYMPWRIMLHAAASGCERLNSLCLGASRCLVFCGPLAAGGCERLSGSTRLCKNKAHSLADGGCSSSAT